MTFSISVFVRGVGGDEKMQWGIGTPPNDDNLEGHEPYPNVPTHTIPTTVRKLTQTTSRWPTQIWFRFYNDKGDDRDIFLEDVKIDDKTVDYETIGEWTEKLEDAEERWEDRTPHPFGMYWGMNYILAIESKKPNDASDSDSDDDDDDFPWLWVGLGAGAFFFFFMMMMMMMMAS